MIRLILGILAAAGLLLLLGILGFGALLILCTSGEPDEE